MFCKDCNVEMEKMFLLYQCPECKRVIYKKDMKNKLAEMYCENCKQIVRINYKEMDDIYNMRCPLCDRKNIHFVKIEN